MNVDTILNTLGFLADHWELVTGLVVAVLSAVRGIIKHKGVSDALQTVVTAIEEAEADDVKQKVNSIRSMLGKDASNAIVDATRKVDSKKAPPTNKEKVLDAIGIRERQ